MTVILDGKCDAGDQKRTSFAFVYLYAACLEVMHVYQSEEINH